MLGADKTVLGLMDCLSRKFDSDVTSNEEQYGFVTKTGRDSIGADKEGIEPGLVEVEEEGTEFARGNIMLREWACKLRAHGA